MTETRAITPTILTASGLTLVLALAACSGPRPKPADFVALCQAEVAPAGTYEYEEGTSLPVIRPIEDGTQVGADSFNACIRQKAAAAGLIAGAGARSNQPACHKGAATIVGGATYCIGVN